MDRRNARRGATAPATAGIIRAGDAVERYRQGCPARAGINPHDGGGLVYRQGLPRARGDEP